MTDLEKRLSVSAALVAGNGQKLGIASSQQQLSLQLLQQEIGRITGANQVEIGSKRLPDFDSTKLEELRMNAIAHMEAMIDMTIANVPSVRDLHNLALEMRKRIK